MSWKTLFAALALSGSLYACRGSVRVPEFNGKIYKGDSKSASIVRAQANESIPASDPRFDEFRCLPRYDLKTIFEIIQSCEKWPEGSVFMPSKKAMKLYRDAAGTELPAQ